MRRQILVRLVPVILAAASALTGFSYEIRAADEKPAESNSAVVPATNNVPQLESELGERDAEEFLKPPAIIPESIVPHAESDDDRAHDEDLRFQDESPKRQSSMLIPTNWKQNARLIPTEIDARFNVIRASLDEPVPETVVRPKAPVMASPKGRAPSAHRAGKVGRPVYTQSETPRSILQSNGRANDPGFIGMFAPLLSVNAPLGVATRPGQNAPQVPTRATRPNIVDMLSVQPPQRRAVPRPRVAPQTVKATPKKSHSKRSLTPGNSREIQDPKPTQDTTPTEETPTEE